MAAGVAHKADTNKNNIDKIMNEKEIKKYLMDNLRIYADIEDYPKKRLVITLMLGRERINDTKICVE